MKKVTTVSLDVEQIKLYKENKNKTLSKFLNDALINYNNSLDKCQDRLAKIVLDYKLSNISYYDALLDITKLSNDKTIVFINEAIVLLNKEYEQILKSK